jgi:hypothetical protein
MKTIILLILLASLTKIYCQEKTDTIGNIDLVVQLIDKDSSYHLVNLYNEEFLDTGFINQPGKGYGQLTGYFKNGEIF